MYLTGLEQEPKTYDYEGIIEWLANSLWVDNYIRKLKGSQWKYTEDFIQEVWVQILSIPQDKIVDAFQMGKGRLISFVKRIIHNQCISKNSYTYKNIQAYDDRHQSLNDMQWTLLDSEIGNDYEGDIEVSKNELHVENPFDELYNDL